MTDLIKREDALATIDTFERDFEQSWRVQFRANIYAIPAVKDDRIEELEREQSRLHTQCDGLMQAGMNNGQALILAEAKLAKAAEALQAAKVYIDDLQSHEGAEGFSVSTAEAAAVYHKALAELECEK